jgi:RNA polymerase sigma-70 factor (ECF subfamily)
MPIQHDASNINHSDLEKNRDYLKFLARTHLSRHYHGRLDPSDIVQQSMLQAFRSLEQYRGTTEQEKLGWLRKILIHTVAHEVRRLHTEGRDIELERSIEQEIEASSFVLDRFLVDSQPSPGQRACTEERNLAMAIAIEALPDPQRAVVIMKFWHDMTISQIADSLNVPFAKTTALMRSATKSLKSALRDMK